MLERTVWRETEGKGDGTQAARPTEPGIRPFLKVGCPKPGDLEIFGWVLSLSDCAQDCPTNGKDHHL